jgi:hypothetical protein
LGTIAPTVASRLVPAVFHRIEESAAGLLKRANEKAPKRSFGG